MKWLRLYTEIRDDPKMRELPDRDFRTFIYLLCTAAEHEKQGYIPGTSQELSWICRSKPSAIHTTLQRLFALHIAEPCEGGIRFLNWEKRQFSSDDINKRVARHRAKNKPSETLHETLHETDRTEQNRTDEFSLIENSLIFTKKKKRASPFVYSDEFNSFWQAYPNKIGKGKAFEEWQKTGTNGRPSLDEILKAIDQQRSSEAWTKDGGQFIPHPATWLHQRRWDDAPSLNGSSKHAGIQEWLAIQEEGDGQKEGQ